MNAPGRDAADPISWAASDGVVFDAAPLVRLWPAPLSHSSIRVEIEPGQSRSGADDQAWDAMCARNPRLFDGSILEVRGLDAASGMVRAVRSRYRRLAVRDLTGSRIVQVAVRAIVTATDAAGRDRVFLGRRGARTRVYPNMWESGPAGGVPPPDDDPERPGSLSLERLREHLRDETHEEAGLGIEADGFVPLGFLDDREGGGFDVLMRAHLRHRLDATSGGELNWEVSETLWLPIDEVPAFDARHAREIIGPTRAAWRFLGWM
ncbi:MAG: NUDIX hydrolase [Phycisphaerae bacterium]|nr:NUDIX hydrolase [Phycisphaerae bacterium]